jgi:hypothetical protein
MVFWLFTLSAFYSNASVISSLKSCFLNKVFFYKLPRFFAGMALLSPLVRSSTWRSELALKKGEVKRTCPPMTNRYELRLVVIMKTLFRCSSATWWGTCVLRSPLSAANFGLNWHDRKKRTPVFAVLLVTFQCCVISCAVSKRYSWKAKVRLDVLPIQWQ